ncbi:MAG: diguanylate cyclase domain-containing protein [Bryobacteraceae bacterium]
MGLAGEEAVPVFLGTAGASLFGLAFLFLWRQSGVMYFGLWGTAWAMEAAAITLAPGVWASRALEVAAAVVLAGAARVGFKTPAQPWRRALAGLLAVPLFLAVLYWFGWQAAHSGLLSAVLLYNLATLHTDLGLGGIVFRAALLASAVWPWLPYGAAFAFTTYSVLAFSAMALWMESMDRRARQLDEQLDRVQRENARNMDLDRLTGLLNRAALERRLEEAKFGGVVAVCDMDDFKEINDRYGHLAGDDILRNIGHLLRASIRPEDEAFRWGGDEFVLLFHNQQRAVAQRRMGDIEARLREFRVRGHGVLPITFSWGTAETGGRSLRQVLDEADRDMYAFKRKRRP